MPISVGSLPDSRGNQPDPDVADFAFGNQGDTCTIDFLAVPTSMYCMVPRSAGQSHTTQLLHGVLAMCLLSIIKDEPSYGYEMVSKLRERGLDLASEGSIYPLLSRLQKQGMIEGYLVQSSEGPARKYYRMSEKGRKVLEQWTNEWNVFRTSVDAVLDGGSDE